MPMLRSAWRRQIDWLRHLPPRRRQALTSLSLIGFALVSLTLYNQLVSGPIHEARLRQASLFGATSPNRSSEPPVAAPLQPERAPTAQPPTAPGPIAAPSQPIARPPVEHLQAPVSVPVARRFGWDYNPVFGDWRLHDGYDYAAPKSAAVGAAAEGDVLAVTDDPKEGTAVTLDHGNGLQTHYAGLSDVAVKVGEHVRGGQLLGRVGSPGYAESGSGPHLHFSVQRGGQSVDPAPLLG